MIILQGARERLDLLAFSPDGRILVAPWWQEVQVWRDPIAGRPPKQLPFRYARSVQFAEDGRLVLGGYRGVTLCDIETGNATQLPEERAGQTHSAVSPDGCHVVLGAVDTRETPPGRLACRPTADPTALAWGADVARWFDLPPVFVAGGARLVLLEHAIASRTSGAGSVFVTRDAATGAVLAEAPGATVNWYRLVMSPDGRESSQTVRCLRSRGRHSNSPIVLRNDNRRVLALPSCRGSTSRRRATTPR